MVATGVLLGALVTLLLIHDRGSGQAAGQPAPARPPLLDVAVAAVTQQTVPVYLEYVGTTAAIRSVVLEAQVTGYLARRLIPDGADVHKGQLLYQIDPRTYQAALDQARAQAQRDAAAHVYAVANHNRDVGLAKTGDVSIDTLQLAASTVDQDAAAQAADRAAVETAQLNLSYTSIRAPFDGRLSLSQVYEGALITVAGTPLNTLVQLDPIYATFSPPDSDLLQIEQAQARHPIATEVLLGNATTPAYFGHVTFLDNTVNPSTGTITTRATIANPTHHLLPGQFIRVRLHIADRPDALLIPQIAVQSNQLGQYVYVIGAYNRVQQRYVTLGSDYGSLVEVTHGLQRGEWVATSNLLQLVPSDIVVPIPDSASRAPATTR